MGIIALRERAKAVKTIIGDSPVNASIPLIVIPEKTWIGFLDLGV